MGYLSDPHVSGREIQTFSHHLLHCSSPSRGVKTLGYPFSESLESWTGDAQVLGVRV